GLIPFPFHSFAMAHPGSESAVSIIFIGVEVSGAARWRWLDKGGSLTKRVKGLEGLCTRRIDGDFDLTPCVCDKLRDIISCRSLLVVKLRIPGEVGHGGDYPSGGIGSGSCPHTVEVPVVYCFTLVIVGDL